MTNHGRCYEGNVNNKGTKVESEWWGGGIFLGISEGE